MRELAPEFGQVRSGPLRIGSLGTPALVALSNASRARFASAPSRSPILSLIAPLSMEHARLAIRFSC